MLRDAVRDMFRKLGTKAAVLSAAFVDLLLEGTNIVQELSTGDVAKTMKKIKIASDADKLAMIVDALVLSSLTQWASDDEEKKFAVLFGVDLKKIKAQAVEEAKKQIEAEKKAAQETDKKAKKTSK